MAKTRFQYMNGLVIVAIVFISLTIVPVGVLSGVIYSEGGYNMHEFTVGPNSTETVHMQVMGDLLFYYDVTTYPVSFEDIEIYLLTETQYESWISSNDSTPQDYVLTTNNDLPFKWDWYIRLSLTLVTTGQHYIVIIRQMDSPGSGTQCGE